MSTRPATPPRTVRPKSAGSWSRSLYRLWLLLSWTGQMLLTLLAVGVMMGSAAYLYLAPLLPAAATYREVQLETPLRIYTADRKLIDEIGNRRNPVTIEEIPQVLIDALIATEDARFYSHPGVDIQSLARGLYGFLTGNSLGGGSTIAMQLANNLSFDSDNVYLRKFKEIPFAIQLHRELDRAEILELYLNLIYFGAGAEGIGAAAYVYYGKQPRELTLAEAAMMVSVLPCPSACNPFADPDRARQRRGVRLRNMLRQELITQQQYETANLAPITARQRSRNIEVSAPWVAEMVRQRLAQTYGEASYVGGFEVITAIDSTTQMAANQALINGLENYYDKRHGYRGPEDSYPPAGDANSNTQRASWARILQTIPEYGNQLPAIVTTVGERRFSAMLTSGRDITVDWDGLSWAATFRNRNEAWPPPRTAADAVQVGDLIRVKRGPRGNWELGQVPEIEGALVAISPDDGAVYALVGGYDFQHSQVNRVTSGRPPGSNFKPFVYGAALENGYSAASLINDAPLSRGDYRPRNFENNFIGPITLRHALRQSRNVPTVRLYEQLGSRTVLDFASRLGLPVDRFPRHDLTVALGSQDLPPLAMVTAYATLANGGHQVQPWLVREISNLADGLLYLANPAQVCEVVCADPPVATTVGTRGTRGARGTTDTTDTTDTTGTTDTTDTMDTTGTMGTMAPPVGAPPFIDPARSNRTDPPDATAADSASATPPEATATNSASTTATPPEAAATDPASATATPPEGAAAISYPPTINRAPQVIDARVAFILNSILRSVIVDGSGARVQRELERSDLMGKTGTTNGPRELWFSGFNRKIAATVFVGLDHPEALGEREQGATVAVPIWIDFMRAALEDIPETVMLRPDGIVDRLINKNTGELATPGEQASVFEFFLEETDPGNPATAPAGQTVEEDEEVATETIF